MSTQSYLPPREEELLTFAQNFSTLITAAPTSYSLVAADATALAALVASYSSALTAATNPSTRTPAAIATKDTARVVLVADIRSLARRIQAAPAVTNAQKVSLGLHIRDAHPTPQPAPATKPVVQTTPMVNRTVGCRVADEDTPTKRAKPPGVQGLQIFSFVGEEAPEELNDWEFEGLVTRTTFDVAFPATTTIGAKVWICVRWYGNRGEAGPMSAAVSSYIVGGVAAVA